MCRAEAQSSRSVRMNRVSYIVSGAPESRYLRGTGSSSTPCVGPIKCRALVPGTFTLAYLTVITTQKPARPLALLTATYPRIRKQPPLLYIHTAHCRGGARSSSPTPPTAAVTPLLHRLTTSLMNTETTQLNTTHCPLQLGCAGVCAQLLGGQCAAEPATALIQPPHSFRH